MATKRLEKVSDAAGKGLAASSACFTAEAQSWDDPKGAPSAFRWKTFLDNIQITPHRTAISVDLNLALYYVRSYLENRTPTFDVG